MNIANLAISQLRRAVTLKEKIAALEKELGGIVGNGAPEAAPKKRRGMSAAGRARVAAAQRKRWAKIKAGKK